MNLFTFNKRKVRKAKRKINNDLIGREVKKSVATVRGGRSQLEETIDGLVSRAGKLPADPEKIKDPV